MDQPAFEFEWKNLERSLRALGASAEPAIFDELRTAYSSRDRHYHTRTHVSECLRSFGRLRHRAEHPAEVEVALWFHDAVYDTRRDDNEARSADWARAFVHSSGASRQTSERVAALILATRTHHGDGDAGLVLDADLGILGASPAAFEEYDRAIRREYQWVPEDQYRAGRARVLRSFLDRPWIYHSDEFRSHFEAGARRNLTGKIAELTD